MQGLGFKLRPKKRKSKNKNALLKFIKTQIFKTKTHIFQKLSYIIYLYLKV